MANQPLVIRDYVPLLDRIKDSLVQVVPEEIALCQFNCGATECSHEEWSLCRRRLEAIEKRDP